MSTSFFKKRTLYVTLVTIVSLAVTFAFNACSDVGFSQSQSSTDPGGPLCEAGQPGCDGPEEPPKKLVDYNDNFTIPLSSSKVDILLVLDNSQSMRPDLQKLAAKLDGLIQILDNGGIDWQMCHVLTGGGNDSVARNWASINKKVLLPSTANKTSIFTSTIDNIPENGNGDEAGVQAIREALSNSQNSDCFRNGVALSVVLISDEDEKSCGGRCEKWESSEVPTATQYRDAKDYRRQFRNVDSWNDPATLVNWVKTNFNDKTLVTHSIVVQPGDVGCYDAQDSSYPAFFAKVYSRLQAMTGGIAGNICAASYSQQLIEMGKRTRDSINSVSLRCAPVGTSTVKLTPTPSGTTWSMNGNKVVFSQPVSEGTSVNVKYTCLE